MKLIVENFGPIKRGEIDLNKKFNLFVGYNNSGKSYMAQLLWGISSKETFRHFFHYIQIENKINKISKIRKIENFKITKSFMIKLLSEFSVFLEKHYLSIILNIDNKHKSVNDISIKFDDITNNLKKLIQVGINATIDTNSFFTDKELSINIKKDTKSDKFSIDIDIDKIDEKELLKNKKIAIFMAILSTIFNRNNFYLPSGRSSYSIFYYYIYQVEKQNKDKIINVLKNISEDNFKEKFEELSSLSSSYTQPMNNLIDKLYNFQSNTKETKYYEDLSNEIKRLIGGEITIKMPKEGIGKKEFYLSLENGVEVPMFLASSNSNQFLTLYLFFKYWANEKDNFLIIDEPEENLHPKNKIDLTNSLVKFANRGNKVLVTTHSMMIADIINNYICLSKLNEDDKKDVLKRYGLDEDIILNEEDVGIYFFNGEEIKEYSVGEYGVMFKDFIEEQKRVQGLSTEVGNLLFEQYEKE